MFELQVAQVVGRHVFRYYSVPYSPLLYTTVVVRQSSHCIASHIIETEQPLCSSRSCATPLLSIQHECRHRAQHLNRCRYRAHHLRHMTYLRQYWARSRPVARIFMATVADRRACRALRATWALHCMAHLGQHDLASCRGCGHYPTYRTCARCHIKWCGACHTWSQLCWKCYRPRHELHDCGEFPPGRRGPGGNGRFEC